MGTGGNRYGLLSSHGLGDSATIALDAVGALWQWDAGRGPRRLALAR